MGLCLLFFVGLWLILLVIFCFLVFGSVFAAFVSDDALRLIEVFLSLTARAYVLKENVLQNLEGPFVFNRGACCDLLNCRDRVLEIFFFQLLDCIDEVVEATVLFAFLRLFLSKKTAVSEAVLLVFGIQCISLP